jgi:hypothetical protein
MTRNRKILIIVLIVASVLLGVVSILIAQFLSNRAATAIPVIQYNKKQTQSFYEEFEKSLASLGCEGIFSTESLTNYSPQSFKVLKNLEFTIVNIGSSKTNPVNCNIFTSDGKAFNFSIFTYDTSSVLAANESLHVNTINSPSIEVLNEGSLSGSKYFFGKSKNSDASCTTNLFEYENKYKYASFTFEGVNDCQNVKQLSHELTYVVSSFLKDLTKLAS